MSIALKQTHFSALNKVIDAFIVDANFLDVVRTLQSGIAKTFQEYVCDDLCNRLIDLMLFVKLEDYSQAKRDKVITSSTPINWKDMFSSLRTKVLIQKIKVLLYACWPTTTCLTIKGPNVPTTSQIVLQPPESYSLTQLAKLSIDFH